MRWRRNAAVSHSDTPARMTSMRNRFWTASACKRQPLRSGLRHAVAQRFIEELFHLPSCLLGQPRLLFPEFRLLLSKLRLFVPEPGLFLPKKRLLLSGARLQLAHFGLKLAHTALQF